MVQLLGLGEVEAGKDLSLCTHVPGSGRRQATVLSGRNRRCAWILYTYTQGRNSRLGPHWDDINQESFLTGTDTTLDLSQRLRSNRQSFLGKAAPEALSSREGCVGS